jgi:hypothetical protein
MIIGSFIVSGIIGEIKYRKRYMEEHQPLISEINRLLNELNDEEELST